MVQFLRLTDPISQTRHGDDAHRRIGLNRRPPGSQSSLSFISEIVAEGGWLSLRDLVEMLADRGLDVHPSTIWRWDRLRKPVDTSWKMEVRLGVADPMT
jgi:hypothetical protein